MKIYLHSCYSGTCFLFAHISFKLFMKKLFVYVTSVEQDLAQRRQERQSKITILNLLKVKQYLVCTYIYKYKYMQLMKD